MSPPRGRLKQNSNRLYFIYNSKLKTFLISLKLSDGNEIQACVLAETRKEAIDTLTANEDLIKLVGDKVAVDIETEELHQPQPKPYPITDEG